MSKQEFLAELWERLAHLPAEDAGQSMDYYSEMIDDRMEEGLSEEEAVRAIGSMDDVVAQILMDTSLPKLVKAKVKQRRAPSAGEIVLLILGSPLWLPLCLVLLVILLVLYLILWAAVLILYALDLTIAVTSIVGCFSAFATFFGGRFIQGVFLLGNSIACAGLAILLFFACNLAVKGALFLSKKILQGLKSCFIRKGDAQ